MNTVPLQKAFVIVALAVMFLLIILIVFGWSTTAIQMIELRLKLAMPRAIPHPHILSHATPMTIAAIIATTLARANR
jgi:hypothetical protein